MCYMDITGALSGSVMLRLFSGLAGRSGLQCGVAVQRVVSWSFVISHSACDSDTLIRWGDLYPPFGNSSGPVNMALTR